MSVVFDHFADGNLSKSNDRGVSLSATLAPVFQWPLASSFRATVTPFKAVFRITIDYQTLIFNIDYWLEILILNEQVDCEIAPWRRNLKRPKRTFNAPFQNSGPVSTKAEFIGRWRWTVPFQLEISTNQHDGIDKPAHCNTTGDKKKWAAPHINWTGADVSLGTDFAPIPRQRRRSVPKYRTPPRSQKKQRDTKKRGVNTEWKKNAKQLNKN